MALPMEKAFHLTMDMHVTQAGLVRRKRDAEAREENQSRSL
jgi:hypothetical protein